MMDMSYFSCDMSIIISDWDLDLEFYQFKILGLKALRAQAHNL